MTRARRASRPRFRLLPTILLTLAILGLPTVVYAWGRNSSSFEITTVRVAGAHLVPEKKALRLLRQEYTGSNLFTVTRGDVRKTLAPLCLVAGATIDRDFPETLAVTITEYRPAAYALAGNRWYVLDRGGYAICTAAEAADQLAGKARASEASPDPSPSAGAATTDGTSADPGAAPTPAPSSSVRRRPGAGGSPAAAHRRLRPRTAGVRRDRQGGRRDARRDRRPAAVAAASADRGAGRRRPAHPPLHRRSGDHVGRLRAHARQDGRPPHRAQEVRGRGQDLHPGGRVDPRQDLAKQCSSRRSSDGRGSLQAVVEPEPSDGPPPGLFDTPRGRGYGRSKVGSPSRPTEMAVSTATKNQATPDSASGSTSNTQAGLEGSPGVSTASLDHDRRVSTMIDASANYLAVIKVVGVGGGGANAVNRMIDAGLRGVEFIAVNTDVQALDGVTADRQAHHRHQDHRRPRRRRPTPTIGYAGGEESERRATRGAQRRGHGLHHRRHGRRHRHRRGPRHRRDRQGGWRADRGVVTKPFTFEGKAAARRQARGRHRSSLRDKVDTLIVIPNDRLLQVVEQDAPRSSRPSASPTTCCARPSRASPTSSRSRA